MAVRPIVCSDNPILRQRSRPVRGLNARVQQLIDDMIETMHAVHGMGLAAVQIGVPERIIVAQLPVEPEEEHEPEAGRLYVIVNPEIVRHSPDTEAGIEGCLSVPGLVGEVARRTAITVNGLDRRGKPVRVKARGLLARVLQHEIDHCDGILFIDHINDRSKLWRAEEE
ncbi:MAG: peptide deformylase [Anaerolineae bacterium]|nr:peptide deformylase [Anaerolineae bacterium]